MAQKTALKSYAADLESAILAAISSLRDAKTAVSMLRRYPELGFAFDPAALDTELDNADGQLILICRMIKAAKGEPRPERAAAICWQCRTPYDSPEDGCDACDA